MNWKAIKIIYNDVLINNCTIEYLGEDKYKITGWYPNRQKYWEAELKDGRLHGKYTNWNKNGQKYAEYNYKNGEYINGKSML